jgi:hypothetical protein
VASGVYGAWAADTIARLRSAESAEFGRVLEERLIRLAADMERGDPQFAESLSRLSRAYNQYFAIRDRLLHEAQVHKLSVEYTNRRPANQPYTSNVRLIYSHQPSASSAVFTLNSAMTLNHQLPAGTTASRFRDVQTAGQIDRPLSDLASLGQTVLILAGYYQWMLDDALIAVPAGTVAPGTTIRLPGEASSLLGTNFSGEAFDLARRSGQGAVFRDLGESQGADQ